ncbi:MAG: hypothetical protein LC667_09255 [Thioalkalivibrio sp.]|nr:hypothetical protein [Thioalkalivibrio sp.]
MPKVYRFGHDFDLQIRRVELKSADGTITSLSLGEPRAGGTRFTGAPVNGRVSFQDWGFSLGLTPSVDESVEILWTRAVYVDEEGSTHSLLTWSDGGLPRAGDVVQDVTLQPKNESVIAAGVTEKVKSLRSGCRSWIAHHEPVIPWNHRKDIYETRSEVDRLARAGHELEYRVPLVHKGEVQELRFVVALTKIRPEGEWQPLFY